MRTTSKLMIGGMAAATFALAMPALAHDGHGPWRHDRHWHGYPVRERVVVREYVRPVPVYPRVAYPVYPAYAAPAPGIHVVIPDIFIRLR